MGTFQKYERQRQAVFKATSPYFSTPARTEGLYKNHPYPYCLPAQYAEENLFAGIRQACLEYFRSFQIKWHDGHAGQPSNHLCDSQVCGVNFLFPFAGQPEALAALLRPLFPSLQEMLPVENGQYVAFEWIGAQNYLGEIKSPNRVRSRGALFTSADAATMFAHRDGKRQVALIEWKYTERYSPFSQAVGDSGRRRQEIYRPFYESPDCPLYRSLVPSFEDLFYEPFYQLMRQQLLANEMEKASELGADIISTLHIAPAHNLDFRRVTSPSLERLGKTATGVWQRLVCAPNRFLSTSTEAFFGGFDVSPFPALQPWWEYISSRYAWIKEPA